MKREKKLRIFISGAARGNPGHGACAAVFYGAGSAVLSEEGKYLGSCAANSAEYGGLRLALQAAARTGAEELEIYSDSELLVRQYAGEAVKDAMLAALLAELRKDAANFKKVSLSHIPREKNCEAGRLVSQLLDNARHVPPGVDKTLARENESR